ncbi:MAG: hypothetical protein O2905_05180 [Proteobacteria bacterium]|nr:hypothetical protein [Pseudomonadota bacterium]MDA1132598.1 hypothetical protein [Pseudomonadota bacterium]
MRAFALVAALLLAAPPALGQDIEAGKLAYQNFEYDRALEIFRPAAEAGDPTAHLYMGLMYMQGRGVEVDRIEAYAWFNLAAVGQIPMAPYYQGRMREGMSDGDLAKVEERSLRYWELYVKPFK